MPRLRPNPLAQDRAGAGPQVPSHNLILAGRRTSIRLEGPFWDSLVEIGAREHLAVRDVVGCVDTLRPADMGLAQALRLAIIAYWRRAAGTSIGGEVPPLLAAMLDSMARRGPLRGELP